MKPLVEALIGKSNIGKATSMPNIGKCDKDELETGDLVLLMNNDVGVVIFRGAEIDKNLASKIHPDGCILFPLSKRNEWTYLSLESYTKDLRSFTAFDYTVKVIAKQIVLKSITQSEDALYNWMINNNNYKHYFQKVKTI